MATEKSIQNKYSIWMIVLGAMGLLVGVGAIKITSNPWFVFAASPFMTAFKRKPIIFSDGMNFTIGRNDGQNSFCLGSMKSLNGRETSIGRVRSVKTNPMIQESPVF